MECFLCHDMFHSDEHLKTHLEHDHLVKHDLDLMILLPLVTESEKNSLYQQLDRRRDNRNCEQDYSAQVNTQESQRNNEVLEVNTLEVNDEDKKSPVVSKIMFWKGIEKSPKRAVNKLSGQKFFGKDDEITDVKKDNFFKRTIIDHQVSRNKAADDAIDMFDKIFDEIFATSCDNLDESVDCSFNRLLNDGHNEKKVIKKTDVSVKQTLRRSLSLKIPSRNSTYLKSFIPNDNDDQSNLKPVAVGVSLDMHDKSLKHENCEELKMTEDKSKNSLKSRLSSMLKNPITSLVLKGNEKTKLEEDLNTNQPSVMSGGSLDVSSGA